jgi:hypothetical protein
MRPLPPSGLAGTAQRGSRPGGKKPGPEDPVPLHHLVRAGEVAERLAPEHHHDAWERAVLLDLVAVGEEMREREPDPRGHDGDGDVQRLAERAQHDRQQPLEVRDVPDVLVHVQECETRHEAKEPAPAGYKVLGEVEVDEEQRVWWERQLLRSLRAALAPRQRRILRKCTAKRQCPPRAGLGGGCTAAVSAWLGGSRGVGGVWGRGRHHKRGVPQAVCRKEQCDSRDAEDAPPVLEVVIPLQADAPGF